MKIKNIYIMKNIRISNLILFALFFLAIGFTSCDDTNEIELVDEIEALTEDEVTNLLFMREEEKLARDAYLYFYDNYELNIFNNIATSEQVHMDAVLTVMEKYGVKDVASSELGVFTNGTLQQLYDDLIAQGNTSLADALTVGVTIEDVDIHDLANAIDVTSQADIINMYEMLACGSRNHMRGFSSQLNAQGETYTPQFITQEQFDEIIDGVHEQCKM